MGYAPVIAFDQARRVAMARQLQHTYRVPLDQITATRSDAELADLWARERTIASLTRLTGRPHATFARYDLGELHQLEDAALRHLMDADAGWETRMVVSITGRRSRPAHRLPAA